MERSISLYQAVKLAAAHGYDVRMADNDEATYCSFAVSGPAVGPVLFQEYSGRDTRAHLQAAIDRLLKRYAGVK